MKTWTMAVAMAWACGAVGCMVDADPTGRHSSSETPGDKASPALAPACDRLDDLGSAAQGDALELDSPSASAQVCVSIVAGAIGAVAGMECKLVEPQGFSLAGCADWYDCGGCIMQLRHNPKNDGWTLEGHTPEGQCATVNAKYELTAGAACESQGPAKR